MSKQHRDVRQDDPPQQPRDAPSPGAPQRPQSDLPQWMMEQYTGAVGLADTKGGPRFKNFIGRFPERSPKTKMAMLSGRDRMGDFLRLKLVYPLATQGYTCLAMTALAAGTSTHYAYAYWRRGTEANPEPEYVCVSPTFDSRDGEYRRRFITWRAFTAAYAKCAKLIANFEEAALQLAMAGQLELRVTVYPEEEAPRLSQTANDLRLMITTFAVALTLDMWDADKGALEAHTNAAYRDLLAYVAGARPELAKYNDQVRADPYLIMFVHGTQVLIEVQCGQKLVPMFVREAMQPGDLNLATWRELTIARLAADLVLNYLTPAFPLYNQWAYIEGADEALFENRAMEDRYRRGRTVEEATESLRAARRVADRDEHSDPNYHLAELSAQIYESLEYAQTYLLMSGAALLHTMEHVGWPLRSAAIAIRRTPNLTPALADVFATRDGVAHFVFDLAYAAHCLHAKLGVVHGDLHGNNMTLYMWAMAGYWRTAGAAPAVYDAWYDDPVATYVAGPRGEADTYVFPAAGVSGCIIDFSRALLGPGFRPRLEEGRGPQYATHFYRDQVNRVMRTLHRYAPSFVAKNEAPLKAAVLANFEAAFPVLCAVDFIAIGRSVAGALLEGKQAVDTQEVRPFTVADAGIALAKQLESAAEEIFMAGLRDLAESAGSRKHMPAAVFPGGPLLARVFADWAFPAWAAREPQRLKTAQLVDAYNFNNGLRASEIDYARYPPWARLDEIERHLGSYKLTDLFSRGPEPFLEALRPSARPDLIAERLRAEQEKLNGRPAATASSWIDE